MKRLRARGDTHTPVISFCDLCEGRVGGTLFGRVEEEGTQPGSWGKGAGPNADKRGGGADAGGIMARHRHFRGGNGEAEYDDGWNDRWDANEAYLGASPASPTSAQYMRRAAGGTRLGEGSRVRAVYEYFTGDQQSTIEVRDVPNEEAACT